MMNCVDKIENKLQHISDKILFTCRYGISLQQDLLSVIVDIYIDIYTTCR